MPSHWGILKRLRFRASRLMCRVLWPLYAFLLAHLKEPESDQLQTLTGVDILEVPARRPTYEERARVIREAEAEGHKLYMRADGATDVQTLVREAGFPIYAMVDSVLGLQAAGWGGGGLEWDEVSFIYRAEGKAALVCSRSEPLPLNPIDYWDGLSDIQGELINEVHEDITPTWHMSSRLQQQLARRYRVRVREFLPGDGYYLVGTANLNNRENRTFLSAIQRIDNRPDLVRAIERREAQENEDFWREREREAQG